MPGIDFGPLIATASGVAVIVAPLLAVGAGLVAVYVNVKAVRQVADAIHGRIVLERQEKEFKAMYAREQKRRSYRQWKAAQVGPRRRRRW